MRKNGEATDAEVGAGGVNAAETSKSVDSDPELTKMVEADFKAMMEQSMAEARAHLSDDPDGLAYVEANYEQLKRGQTLQRASQAAFDAGDSKAVAELDRQKSVEIAETLARVGKRGGLFTRLITWFLRRNLGR